MRYFIALEIPSQNIPSFQAIQKGLHTLIPQARLTDCSKIHLTLAFLGEQPDSLKKPLTEVLKQAVSGTSPFKVTPAYIDGFPNIHHPQVLWVGVKGDIDKILIIHERIEDRLASLNLPTDERRFIPHISIAKLNNNFQIDGSLERSLEQIMACFFQPIQITCIKLFESIPSGGFHQHNTLAETRLG